MRGTVTTNVSLSATPLGPPLSLQAPAAIVAVYGPATKLPST